MGSEMCIRDRFNTSNISRLSVSNAGKVKIGSNHNSVTAELDVDGDISCNGILTVPDISCNNNLFVGNKVGIGTQIPSKTLEVIGDISFSGNLYQGNSLFTSGGGGGGSLTIQDEGSSLSTAATTLNFVGTGVTASGTGATKTITIPGGGGDVFKNIAMPDGSTVVAADSATDTLTLSQSGLVSITGNSTSDTVDIGTASAAQIPFLKADGSSSDIDLQTSGKISEILTNLHIPFTKADGTDVTTLVVG